jgi:hypothetical protein
LGTTAGVAIIGSLFGVAGAGLTGKVDMADKLETWDILFISLMV